ncbi:testis-expressed protein 9 isoform X2 [Belonocnema kinseyi]|uniref:testis-expressed protein 9 isoform X2 n=1 Tax=Belonocnema kinseyi TaxID=2817044 RepID=UPI00143D0F4B|nr:testis-expressed protein 9 isoform X2 [Belonocnema kinseyi]
MFCLQCNYCKELEAESKKQAETREKLQNQISAFKDTVSKLETGNGNFQIKIQEQSVESAALKKEIEDLKREVKTSNQQNITTEVRLNRSLEENEKLRTCLKFTKLEEKDLRDQIRKLQEEKRLSIKNMEKQRSELYQAYKKQLHLVDNLKKQKYFISRRIWRPADRYK